MGIGAALVGGSVASGLVSAGASKSAAKTQAKAADKAAEAQLQATRETNDLQRQQYNTSLSLFQPQWQSGVANQAALDYVLGTGARPNTLTFNYPGAIDGVQNGTPGVVETMYGGGNKLAGGAGGILGAFLPAAQSGAFPGGMSSRNSLKNLPGVRDATQGGSSTYYKVGDKTFATMEEAQRYANGLGNGGGSTFAPTYNGYQPYKQYFAGLEDTYRKDLNTLYSLDYFKESPDYQFRKQEGFDAINSNAAARGLRLSGDTLKAGANYASNLADSEWTDYLARGINNLDNRYNRQAGTYINWLSGLQGQAMDLPQTTSNISNAGNTYATNAGNALMNAGQAQAQAYTNAGAAKASGYEGAASAFNNTVGNIGQMWMMNKLTNNGLWGTP